MVLAKRQLNAFLSRKAFYSLRRAKIGNAQTSPNSNRMTNKPNTCELKTPGKPCASCPWRRTSTAADIPNFSLELAEGLSSCSPDSRNIGPEWNAKLFACHQSKPDAEFLCAGWLATVGHRHPQVRFEVFSKRLDEATLSPGTDWPELHANWPEALEKLRSTLPETIEKEEQ
jgi:hypothetical protein